jgi:hypothetical protein
MDLPALRFHLGPSAVLGWLPIASDIGQMPFQHDLIDNPSRIQVHQHQQTILRIDDSVTV